MKRTLFAIVMTLVISAAMLAQGRRVGPPNGAPPDGPPPAGGQFGQRPDPLATLKAALGLTDAQVDAIKALIQTRQERAQAIFADIKQKREALDALLDAATPNATNVGNAAIALRAAEKSLRAEQDWFISELKKLLTGAQQQTLDNLITASNGRLPLGLGGPGPGPGRGPGRGRGPGPDR
jgi:Spy/CpxP family protein refolding chaperone